MNRPRQRRIHNGNFYKNNKRKVKRVRNGTFSQVGITSNLSKPTNPPNPFLSKNLHHGAISRTKAQEIFARHYDSDGNQVEQVDKSKCIIKWNEDGSMKDD